MAQSRPLTTLQQQLKSARAYNKAIKQRNATGDLIYVPGTGKVISSAYEQLRNAAEYNEGRIVLERAIKRFYRRMLFVVKRHPEGIGQELITELVLGGYLLDNECSTVTADSISQLAVEYMAIYARLRQAHNPQRKAQDWVLAILSVRTEDLLRPYAHYLALVDFTYQQFLRQLPKGRLLQNAEPDTDYELSLYVAIHQALLKSDIDVVRADILRLSGQTADTISTYAALNRHVDTIYTAGFTLRLRRLVSKNGAPYRILKSLIDDVPTLLELLPDREAFLQAYDVQIKTEYARIARRLNKGLIKSVIFLFITKGIIGMGIEVPFDLIVYGSVVVIPFTVNLLFPPLYIAALRLGVRMPTNSDAQMTRHFMDRLLYGDGDPKLTVRERTRPYSFPVKVISSVFFLAPFVVTYLLLRTLHFNPLQMGIFFVFFSTASFLGFVLRGMVRELRMDKSHMSILSVLLDFFYLPFILFGRWLAGKYARINFVGVFLDTVIELPLKTLLHVMRQWVRFVTEKYEEIY